jgi:hypothetical protein
MGRRQRWRRPNTTSDNAHKGKLARPQVLTELPMATP